jgi:hypothetical protein
VRWLGERVDIHDGKVLQSRLREERALLTAVLENLPVGVSVADPSGRLTMINKRTFEIWRGRQSESRSVAEYGEWRAFHPDGRRYEGADWPIARSLSARETVTDHECVFERCDGTRGILNLCTAPVLNERGELIAAVATCADVTDLRRMHEAETRRLAAEQLAAATRNLLSNCSHELRTVGRWPEMGNLDSCVSGEAGRREVIAGTDGVCYGLQQGFAFCVGAQELHTSCVLARLPGLYAAAELPPMRNPAAVLPLSPLLTDALPCPLWDLCGESPFLRRAAAFDPRLQPVAGMLGMAELLLDTSLSEEQLDYVKIIHESGKLLLTVISDVLDFSRIESGKLELESISFKPRAVIKHVLALMKEIARSKGVALAVCRG